MYSSGERPDVQNSYLLGKAERAPVMGEQAEKFFVGWVEDSSHSVPRFKRSCRVPSEILCRLDSSHSVPRFKRPCVPSEILCRSRLDSSHSVPRFKRPCVPSEILCRLDSSHSVAVPRWKRPCVPSETGT